MLTYLLKRGRRGTQKRLSVSASPDSTSSPLSSGAILRCPSFGWVFRITLTRLLRVFMRDVVRVFYLRRILRLMGLVAQRPPPFD